MIIATIKTEAAREKLMRMRDGITAAAFDGVVENAARRCQSELVNLTPKRWFGQARAGWIQPGSVLKPQPGVRIIRWNAPPGVTVPIMKFLEEGTKDHGPVTAKALFIPLTKQAVTALQSGSFAGMGSKPVNGVVRSTLYVRTQSVRRGVELHGIKTLVEGVDYIWRKRVSGITASHMVRNFRSKARELLKNEMVKYVRGLIRSTHG